MRIGIAAVGIVALAIGSGCATRSDRPSSGDGVPATTAPTTITQAAAPTKTVTVTQEEGSSRAAAPTKAVPATTLDEPAFWRLIVETRRAAGNDTGRQSELLEERLTRLSPQAIVEFSRIRRGLDRRAYTWKLWGAATVIEDGCSDDCFRDFRAYVIALGPGPFRDAVNDPDSLASVVQDAEQGDWENADDVAPDAYSSVTGDDFPLDSSDLSGRPEGRPFNENDRATLVQRYPRLAARFR